MITHAHRIRSTPAYSRTSHRCVYTHVCSVYTLPYTCIYKHTYMGVSADIYDTQTGAYMCLCVFACVVCMSVHMYLHVCVSAHVHLYACPGLCSIPQGSLLCNSGWRLGSEVGDSHVYSPQPVPDKGKPTQP